LANSKGKPGNKKPAPQKSSKGVNWFLLRIAGAVLGGLFFYAGWQKNLRSYEFADAVLAYQLGPVWLAGVVAAVLPWVELTAGSLLVVGLKRRSCLLIIALLLAAFLLIMLVTLARGLNIDCGCGLFFQRQVGPAALLEDLAFLAWAGGLYWWECKIISNE
jgi:putative oxidoreductase